MKLSNLYELKDLQNVLFEATKENFDFVQTIYDYYGLHYSLVYRQDRTGEPYDSEIIVTYVKSVSQKIIAHFVELIRKSDPRFDDMTIKEISEMCKQCDKTSDLAELEKISAIEDFIFFINELSNNRAYWLDGLVDYIHNHASDVHYGLESLFDHDEFIRIYDAINFKNNYDHPHYYLLTVNPAIRVQMNYIMRIGD